MTSQRFGTCGMHPSVYARVKLLTGLQGMLEGIIQSIGTPGVNPGLIKVGYLIFVMLIVMNVCLFIGLGPNIHVLILSVLSLGVFGGLQWSVPLLWW